MQPYIGTPTSRIDGHAKVTGAAKYAAEFNVAGLAHASIVSSTIAKGRILRIETSEAMRVDGVCHVLTHLNRPPMADTDSAYKDDVGPEVGSPFRPLYDDKILFNRQPIALVIAEEPEIARFAASLVSVVYEENDHATDLFSRDNNVVTLKDPAPPRGDAEKAYADSDVRIEADYFIPMEHHNPMELYAATAVWENGRLTVYDKTQGVQNVQRYLCNVFAMKPDEVKVMSPFMGGGFGVGLRPQYEAVLAVLAARALKRSVRVVLTRQQMYGLSYRPATIEHLAIGAKAGGTLNAITHEATAMTSTYEDFARNDTSWSGLLYKSSAARYSHKIAKLDLPTPSDMRAPGAATGVYALECAMDELAVALKLDPLELRYRVYSDRDQDNDVPFTSNQLRECYRQGAQAFGWARRNPEPRSMRDGHDLIGWGMATGIWDAMQMNTAARVLLTSNGYAEVACGTSDIGTGTYTIMAQVTADTLGLPIENVTIRLGDSTLPRSPVEGGSWTAASVCHAIANAAEEVKEELLRLANKKSDSLLHDATADDVSLAGGRLTDKRDPIRFVSIADAMRYGGVERIEKEASNGFKGDLSKGDFGGDPRHARNTHSAIFAEVRVDDELGLIRVTRVVNAIAAGKILNPKTAGSQIIGGVVWGIGMALHEETLVDHTFGRIMNANIAEYHVPVNADVRDIKVLFVDEPDATINPLGIKGVGEIGIVGVAAAIANAVYHATGKRVRDLPITLDKLM
jgi:xanthine dehydrogenase YagR molybdenum-binding subunit